MSQQPIKVLCVDDNPDLARLLDTRLGFQDDMRSVGCVLDIDRLVDTVRDTQPDVILLDLTMFRRSTLDYIPAMVDACPAVRTLVYSGFDGKASIERARAAGVWGYVSKAADMDALIGAIRDVASGKRVFPAGR